jgi:mono/diheme cytochrome c family protein
MRMRSVCGSVAAILVVQLLGCSGAFGGDPEPWRAKAEREARVAAGESLFGAYCSSCHGTDAKGNGPVAPALRTKPADLTRIAERSGGTFDAAKVAAFIDGRMRIEAHGEREMPVWGRLYDDRNQNIMTDERLLSPGMIFDLVEYLRTIQAAGAPKTP